MRTVKEVSGLTGISVRTLHYYDEIGLLKPSKISEAGYRLYDDKALEDLQQILFFREFDMPLKEIKAIMEDPAFDRNYCLRSQREMLVLKKERLERLIAGIDDILGGHNSMDFKIFSKDDIESIFQSQMSHMTEEQRNAMTEKYGGEDGFHKYFIRQMESEQVQKNFKKVLEWYGGDKEKMLENAKTPIGPEILKAYQKRLDAVVKKMADRKELPVTSFEVKETAAEYGFVIKQMFRLKDESRFMRETAELYRTNAQMREAFDRQYGEGMAERFAEVVLETYEQGI